MPKLIKIGEIRVLIYFDLPWNEPEADGEKERQMERKRDRKRDR